MRARDRLDMTAALLSAREAGLRVELVGDIDVPDQPPPMPLTPFVLDEGPAVIFGKRGAYKSWIAQMIGTSVATGRELIPGSVPVVSGPVIWADWESSRRRLAHRQRWLPAADLIYVPCEQPIWDLAEPLAALVDGAGAAMVIVDSMVMATGGMNPKDAETATRYFGALNLICPRSLSLGHVPHDSGDSITRPYGSVFFDNMARLTWAAVKDDFGRLTLSNHKHTDGELFTAMTLELDFDLDDHRLTVRTTTPRLTTAVLAGMVTGEMTFDAILEKVRAAGFGAGRRWLFDVIGSAVSDGSIVKARHGVYGPRTALSPALSLLEAADG